MIHFSNVAWMLQESGQFVVIISNGIFKALLLSLSPYLNCKAEILAESAQDVDSTHFWD